MWLRFSSSQQRPDCAKRRSVPRLPVLIIALIPWNEARPAVRSHLEAILFELEQVRMVGAEQKGAAAGVGVGVADLLGAAAPTSDRDVHFESLHAHTEVFDKKRLTYDTIRGRRTPAATTEACGM